jgi:predicted membrane-bound dolichyl-phosphate-mannose-protein mannosyltransferase
MKKTAKFKAVPLIATFLFSFDTLIFVQSRIAILDIFTLTFMLLGFYWYFSGHSYLSALGMSLATLTKITGAAGFGIIVVIHVIKSLSQRERENVWDSILPWFEKYAGVFLASFILILWILDRVWVGYSTPFEHLAFILDYSGRLTSSCPNGIISCPWQWFVNQIQIPYLIVNVQVTSGGSVAKYDSVAFWGMMNPTIMYLTIPSMIYSAYSYYERQDDFSLFVLVWFAATYLPFLPAVILGHRVTYLFYLLLAMPAVAGAVAHMIADQNPPKLVVLFYLAVVVIWFSLMFPFKVFPS